MTAALNVGSLIREFPFNAHFASRESASAAVPIIYNPFMSLDDRELKQAALIGLRRQLQRIADLIGRLEQELGTGPAQPAPRKRRLSAAGRANIVAALKKR